MKTILIFIFAILVISASGCGPGNSQKTIIIDQRDSGAYKLGMRHGKLLLEKDSEDSIQDFLLDVRARETNIKARLRESAGDAYIEGFKDYITAHNDSMARILF